MAMRATWTGQLGFGLVNLPIKLYKATDSHDTVLHQYVVTEEGPHRVGRKNIDLETGAEVDFPDIVSGAEVEDGQVVIVTKDDKESIEAEAGKFIEIEEFVDASEVDPLMYDVPQYVGANKGGEKAYALLANEMTNSGLVAVAKFTQRGKTQRVVIRVLNGVLVLHTLLWADEIRPADGLGSKASFSDAEEAAAKMLVASMVGKFDPEAHSDTYQERLGELIAAKAAGEEFTVTGKAVVPDDVSDLLAKLEASVAKKGKRQDRGNATVPTKGNLMADASTHAVKVAWVANNHGYPYRATCSCGWKSATYVAAHSAQSMGDDHVAAFAADAILKRAL